MDEANLTCTLSASMMGYVGPRDEVYINTRFLALGEANPYWALGDAFSAIGGPDNGPAKGCPLASIAGIMTSEDESGEEIRQGLRGLLASTDGLGMFDWIVSYVY